MKEILIRVVAMNNEHTCCPKNNRIKVTFFQVYTSVYDLYVKFCSDMTTSSQTTASLMSQMAVQYTKYSPYMRMIND